MPRNELSRLCIHTITCLFNCIKFWGNPYPILCCPNPWMPCSAKAGDANIVEVKNNEKTKRSIRDALEVLLLESRV